MRLHEIKSTFYIALDTKHPAKTIISVQASVYPLGALLEGRLESRRPETCLSRASSLYLHARPPTNGAYVYEVRPRGKVDRQHTAWLDRLTQVKLDCAGEIDQLCLGYWSGRECPEMRASPWQYRTLEAVIMKRVGGWELP